MLPGAGTQVHHEVGGVDGFLVMLHHDHGVAQIPHLDQGIDQAAVIPLMQADGRFVQYIDHSHQPGTDLGGQPDPLGFATTQRPRGPVQRQVRQPHVVEELEPFADFLQHFVRDPLLIVVERQLGKRVQRVLHREFGIVHDISVVNSDRKAFRLQPTPAARGTGPCGHEPLHLFLHVGGCCFLVPSLQLGNDSFKPGPPLVPGPFPAFIDKIQGTVGAIQDHVPYVSRNLTKRGVKIKIIVNRHGFQHRAAEA